MARQTGVLAGEFAGVLGWCRHDAHGLPRSQRWGREAERSDGEAK
jgi:hypothetical protein